MVILFKNFWHLFIPIIEYLIVSPFDLIHIIDTFPQSLIPIFWHHQFTYIEPRVCLLLEQLNICCVKSKIRSHTFIPQKFIQINAFVPLFRVPFDRQFRVLQFDNCFVRVGVLYIKNVRLQNLATHMIY